MAQQLRILVVETRDGLRELDLFVGHQVTYTDRASVRAFLREGQYDLVITNGMVDAIWPNDGRFTPLFGFIRKPEVSMDEKIVLPCGHEVDDTKLLEITCFLCHRTYQRIGVPPMFVEKVKKSTDIHIRC
jgi:hypothetical protein